MAALRRCGRETVALLGENSLVQRRWYTPPSRRTWSKQHHRIRIPRPMVDKFDLRREHPEKEWWRERRIAPATYFGFPDVAKQGLRGGELYVEQMDAVTLAVLADRCLKEKVWDPEIWSKFCWRAQQMASRTHEPDLCYIFRAFSRADWFDQNFLSTYLGRVHRRLHCFQLPDTAVVLEAFANPKFRQSDYLQKTLTHLSLLLQHRDDAQVEDLARACVALGVLKPLPHDLAMEVLGALQLLAEALLLRELSELDAGKMIHVLDCYASWGLVSRELAAQSSAPRDLAAALTASLQGRLAKHSEEKPDDLGTLALAMAQGGVVEEELWGELVESLEASAHFMSGPAVAAAAYGVARGGVGYPGLNRALARRLAERRRELSAMDCARAAGGFLRGARTDVAEGTVLRGPVAEQITELGFEAFDPEALALLLDSLSRAPADASGVEQLASGVLQAVHGRLEEFSPRQLASVARSLGTIQPSSVETLAKVLGAAQEAVQAAISEGGCSDLAGLPPRYVAMLCQGLAAQTRRPGFAAAAKMQELLPSVATALEARPTSVTVAQLLRGLLACPKGEERTAALDRCAELLLDGAPDLSAMTLVHLCETLAALSDGSWKAPDKLLRLVTSELDKKRYDLPKHQGWRAKEALEKAGGEPGALRLEARDQPAR